MKFTRSHKIWILLVIGLFASCKKKNKLTQFTMSYAQTVVIPSSTGVNLPFNIFTPDMTTNSESTFEVNNTRKDLIQEIKLTKLDLLITSPSNGNFQFLKSVEIYISASGLQEVMIAKKDNIPSDIGNYINLDCLNSDLKEYIKKDQFKLRLNTVTDQIITSDYEIALNSKFLVDAKILGL